MLKNITIIGETGKAVSVIKKFPFILGVILCLIDVYSTSAQQMPIGTYQRKSVQVTGDLLELRKDSIFYKRELVGYSFSHIFYKKCRGKYNVSGDTLTFNYTVWKPPGEFIILEEETLVRDSSQTPATALYIKIKMKTVNYDSINHLINSYDSALTLSRADIHIYDERDSVTTNIGVYGGRINLALKNPNRIVVHRRKAYPLQIDLTQFIDKAVTLECILYAYDGKYCTDSFTEKYLIKENLPGRFVLNPVDSPDMDLVYELK